MKLYTLSNDIGLLILRVSTGVLMLLHGISKIIHPESFESIKNLVIKANLPSFISYGVYIGEVIIPVLLILGIATRASALIFAINMIFAVMLAHSAHIFMLSNTGGWFLELQGLYFFAALALLFTGGGKFSISNKYPWD